MSGDLRARRRRTGGLALVVSLLLVLATPAGGGTGDDPGRGRGRPDVLEGSIDLDLAHDPGTCDPLGGERCILPFPNDHFTVTDRGTATGRRVALSPEATPVNRFGTPIDPTELNRNDGFSPGGPITVLLPGVDLAASGAAPITDMGASLDGDAPIVLLDARTGERHPYWAEIDSRAPDDAHRMTFIRPATNLREGRRYVVAIRDVVDGAGRPIEPTHAFRAYRDRLDTGIPAVEDRRPHMEDVFETLRRAGIPRDDLVIAWDFTAASAESLSERVLAMRDDAFRSLGPDAPGFTVTNVEPSGRANLMRDIEGTFEVPNYLTGDGGPGEVLNNGDGPGDDPVPERNGTMTARFICTIPESAVDGAGNAHPTRMALYGHGLLGTAREVRGASSRMAAASNTTFCATWWIGMSEDDIGPVIEALVDMSHFRPLPDRLQQSMLNFLFLGRLMLHPDGLSSHPAFQAADGTPLLDQRNLSFVGVSQGGIIGGALSAVAQDWRRSFLGVPAMNYSTLLDRSVDFDPFAALFDPSYPDWIDRQLAISLAQMLWDRGETNGYAQHLTRHPYRGTPPKRVMLFEAFGDHQVANVATEVMARTIGAELRVPALADGRSPDVEPFWDIPPVRRMPDRNGSYLVVWDFGTPAPPLGNEPNRAGEDPHGMGRDHPAVLELTRAFLEEGLLVDTCGGAPCTTPG